MLYCLEAKIITNNPDIITVIKNKIPDRLDSKMWVDDYDIGEGTDADGNKMVYIEVRFKLDADRQATLNWIKDKAQNVVGQLLAGSYLSYHLCDHNEVVKNGCSKPIILWSK